MNKELILDCFFKERKPLLHMAPLADLYYSYITKEKLDPANFLVTNQISKKDDMDD